jgi:putative hydrolase of the HAD superfamily
MPRRFVAFDMGNVLVDYRPEATLAALAEAAGLAPARVEAMARAFLGGTKRRVERGEYTPRAFYEAVNAEIRAAGGRALGWEEFARSWTASVAPRPGAEALVARLAPGVPFALWSNTDPIHFARLAPEMPYLARARSVFLSFVAGVAKPERAFYEQALAALGAAPAEVAFADDSAENVDAARALGIDAFLAGTLAAAQRGLAARGLVPEDDRC